MFFTIKLYRNMKSSITPSPLIPQLTLPIDAMGNHICPTEALGPDAQTPLQPLNIECKLVNHPDKVFIQQLISNLVHGCSISYNGP